MIIRSASHGDIDAIKRIEGDTRLSVLAREDYESAVSSASSIILVAEVGAKVEAFLLARLITKTELDSKRKQRERKEKISGTGPTHAELEICSIAVGAPLQRKGIGSRLMSEFFRRCSEFNRFSIFLEVRALNAGAIGFYRAFGFEKTGRRKDYYRNPRDDAQVMTFNSCRE